MTNYIIFGGGACLLAGGLLFAAVAWALGRINKIEFTKLLVGFLIVHGVIWIDFSYGLAWMERTQIAESLSKTALIEIIAVALIYCLKSLFENISKHNVWPDKPLSLQEFCANEPTEGGEIK